MTWTNAVIGDLVEPKVDQGGPSQSEFTYVDISSIDNATKRVADPKRLPREEAPSRARQRLKARDVVVSMTRPNLNAVALLQSELDGAIGSTGFDVLRVKIGVEPTWLYYAVQTPAFIHAMSGVVQGALYPAVRPKDIRGFPLTVPPLEEQRRIVAEIEEQLSRLEAGVAALKRVQANVKRYRASVLAAACSNRLVPTEAALARAEGRSYETGNLLLARILQERRNRWTGKGKYQEPAAPDTTGLPGLPEGWAWANIEQLGDVIGGLTKNPKRKLLPLKLPYLRVANVYADELRLDDIEHIGVSDAELEKLRLSVDDLLVVEGNGSLAQIGRVARWDGSIDPCVHQNHLIKVRLAGVNVRWAMQWLLSMPGRAHIETVAASTSGLHTLSTGKVARLPVPLPPLPEQHRIVAEVDRRLSVVREIEQQVEADVARADRLRQSTLQRAFSPKAIR